MIRKGFIHKCESLLLADYLLLTVSEKIVVRSNRVQLQYVGKTNREKVYCTGVVDCFGMDRCSV
jgi:hypothetical protein